MLWPLPRFDYLVVAGYLETTLDFHGALRYCYEYEMCGMAINPFSVGFSMVGSYKLFTNHTDRYCIGNNKASSMY